MSIQHELRVLTRSKELILKIYKFCEQLPEKEKFGLWSQITRASVSIASNIAEGQQRTDKEFVHFLRIARGSIKELEIQLYICKEYYKIESPEIFELLDILGGMTYRLMQKAQADSPHG